jgi:chromate transporter
MAAGSALEVLAVALRLGLTSFGGPVAHIGYQRETFVARHRWLDEDTFGELVALCQTLPGPGSSQLTTAVGAIRAGWAGALAAWIGFTLPSAALMTAVGLAVATGGLPDTGPRAGLVAGFQVAAVAVVAQAVLAMGRRLTPDGPRLALAGAVALLSLAIPTPLTQLLAIVIGALFGVAFLRGVAGDATGRRSRQVASPVTHRASIVLVAIVVALLAGLPVVAAVTGSDTVAFASALVRTGALVFGGGHVVLPLLDAAVVRPGWVSQDAFLAGYGAAAVLPLFSFAAYPRRLDGRTRRSPAPCSRRSRSSCQRAARPPPCHLDWLRGRPSARAALAGVNAAVVGILAAALVTPVVTTAIRGPLEAVLAVAGAALLISGRLPPLAVVLPTAIVMAVSQMG